MMWQGGGSTLAFYTASATLTNLTGTGTWRLDVTFSPANER